MYIIVAGAGLVGRMLAKALLDNRHDVVVMDRDEHVCDRLYANTGVVCVQGDASNMQDLEEAGIDKADVVVAATPSDAANLACTILAKSRDVPRVITRMRNAGYENAYRLAGADRIVRVTDLLANQMLLDIEQPDARRISTIGRGKANIFAVSVPEDALIAGRTVQQVAGDSRFPDNCIFVAVVDQTSGDLHIPRGDTKISSGAEIYLISSAADIDQAVEVLRETAKQPD